MDVHVHVGLLVFHAYVDVNVYVHVHLLVSVDEIFNVYMFVFEGVATAPAFYDLGPKPS